MRIGEGCVACIYNNAKKQYDCPEFLREVSEMLKDWDPKIPAPYFEHLVQVKYREYTGTSLSFSALKKQYNDLALSYEPEIQKRISASEDPLKTALFMARIGNYIDFTAMKDVRKEEFLNLLFSFTVSGKDEETYASFLKACGEGKNFLLVADNTGEIVLDRLMITELRKRFPHLRVMTMVRGGEVSNDAVTEDAVYARMDTVSEIISSGIAMAGAVVPYLSEEALQALSEADVILSKGQGNFESLESQGYHVFYSFLCKCDMFVAHFGVPRFTGMFIEEIP